MTASFVVGSLKSLVSKSGSGVKFLRRLKLMLISDHAKDFVKYCLEGGGLMSPFQPLVYIKDLEGLCESRKVYFRRFMWRKRAFFLVILRCFARVKCGNIMSGFWKCCDCRESDFIV